MKNRLISSLVLLAALLCTIGAFAQSDAAPGVDIAPGVARMSLINGDVSTQRGDSGEWAAAVLNAPIVSGDKVSTGDNARAEVQLDFANVLRLGDRSQATIANLTRNQVQVQIGEGIANYDVFQGSEAAAEVDTPNVAIHPQRDGASFRVIVNSNDETQIIVRRGEVDLSTAQGSTKAEPGQMITVHGSGDETAYKTDDAPANDDWDSWISERDSKIQNAKSWGKTDRYYTGSEDLDAYGQWKTAPDYGQVWVPAVGQDWVPYRDGRWVWEPYYGWTWVPNEPWGWAPYHYGRWFYYNSAWAWWPGPVVAAPYYRPIWAPAYVSFFGFGGGFGVSAGFGFGSFGWLPLGPGDFYHPWWGGYRNRFNVVNVTNITNIYNYRGRGFGGLGPLRENGFSNLRLAGTNEHILRAVSTVPAGGFGTGRMGARPVDPGVFREGRMMTGNLPVVPSRESLSASNRPANSSTMRNGGQARFFSNARPATVQPFERQAAQLQQSIQRDNHFTPVRSGGQLNARTESPSSIRPSVRDIPPLGSNGSLTKPSPEIRSQTSQTTQPRNTTNGFTRFGSQAAQDRSPSTEQKGAGQNGRQASNSGSFRNNVPRPPQTNQSQSPRFAGSDQSGWHRFSDTGTASGTAGGSGRPSSTSPRNVPRPPSSANPSSERPMNRSYSAPRPPASNSRGGSGSDYRPFASAPRNSGPQPSNRGYGAGDTSRFPSRNAAPSPGGGSYRGPSSPSYSASSRGNSRPPLDMRQPIVGGRSSGGSPSGGGYRGGSPSFHSSGGGSSHGGGGSSHSGNGGGRHR
jgi:hypothetical protein